jgi:uncharacterized protein YndB with AHSA1/START domain
MLGTDSFLVIRRSILIKAPPDRVWREFETFDRMNAWWGALIGEPEAGKPNGQRLVTYEPRVGGRIEMEVDLDGAPARYGGPIVTFEPACELTFDNDWIPNMGWRHPTRLTLRLTPALGGTVVEILHYAFEGAVDDPGEEHSGYEGGWGMTQLSALRELVRSA